MTARLKRVLKLVDVAVFYGECSGGVRTYLDAKAVFASETGSLEHHLIVPGRRELHAGGRHELPGLLLSSANGYRVPLGYGALARTLRALRPDVILLHDACWHPRIVVRLARELGAACAIVHHCSIAHAAEAVPGPTWLYRPIVRAWLQRAYRCVGTVLAIPEVSREAGSATVLPFRLGLDPAFRPRNDVERGEHVLYVGRFAREKGVLELLEAVSRSDERWDLHLIGAGPLRAELERRSRRLRIQKRIEFHAYVRDREYLARAYAAAACVVVPAAFETFGLVTLEAAACGARVVACETSPAGRAIGGLAHRFPAGNVPALIRAIDQARLGPRDLAAAAEVASRHSWSAAFEGELRDLRRLAAAPRRRGPLGWTTV